MTIVIIELDDDRNYICQALRFGIFDMRVSKEKAADNRDRILTAASRLIRERGIAGVGVDTLTEAAGMTHGSLYSQFGSKQRLVEEAIAAAIASKGRDLSEGLSRKPSQRQSPLRDETSVKACRGSHRSGNRL